MKAIFGALLISLLAIGQAHAGPTSLSGAGVTGTYSAGSFGYASPVVEAFNAEFLTEDGDFNQYFFIDFDEAGLITVYNNLDNMGPFAAGSQILDFTFAGLAEAIIGFDIVDASQVSGLSASALSIVDATTIQLDLSAIAWGSAYSSFSAQLNFGPLGGDVPVPGSLALLGLGLATLASQRARRV